MNSIFKILIIVSTLFVFTACKNTGGVVEGTINDVLDRATLIAGNLNISVVEGNSNSILILFDKPIGREATLDWALNAPAGQFVRTSGSLQLAKGAQSTVLQLDTVDNTDSDGNRVFLLTLSGSAMVFSNSIEVHVAILDDETDPTISIANFSAAEGNGGGNGNFNFTVTADRVLTNDITVLYATSNGTALAGSDYTNSSGTATILAGSSTTQISVPVAKDAVYESNEIFTLTLSGGSGYTVAGSTLSATGTIENDDFVTTTWDFASASDYIFNSDYIDVTSGTKAALKTVNTTFDSAATFNKGTYLGTFLSGGKLTVATTMNVALDATWMPEPTSLIAYWKMDGNFNDSSGNSHTLTATTGATTATGAKIGTHTASFTGGVDTRLSVASHADFNMSAGTVCMWLKTPLVWGVDGGSGTTSWSGYASLFSRVDSANDRNGINIVVNPSGELIVTMNDASAVSASIAVPATIKAATWQHMCAVFRRGAGEVSQVFVDGVFKGEATNSTAWAFNNQSVLIADSTNSWYEEFAGQLDDIAVWGAALTANQIASMYYRQSQSYTNELSPAWTPKFSNLISYWKMDGDWVDTVTGAAGTPHGSASAAGTAKIGLNSASFATATSDYLDLGNRDAVNAATTMSVCSWVNHTTVNDDDAIFTNWAGGTAAGVYLLRDDVGGDSTRPDTYKIYVRNTLVARGIEGAASISVVGRWTHVCFTYLENNASGLHLYIDGQEDPNSPVSTVGLTGVNPGTYPLTIGGTSGGNYFEGKIDDVALWDTMLSSNSIKLIYNRQKQKYVGSYESPVIDLGADGPWTTIVPVTPLAFFKELPATASESYSGMTGSLMTNLVGYWPFNGNGNGVDASGTAQNLSPQNSPTTTTGVFNTAAALTGNNTGTNQFYTNASSTLVSSLTAATFSCWISPATLTGTLITDTILADQSFRVSLLSGKVQYSHYDGVNTRTLVTTATPIKTKQLAHVLVRRAANAKTVDIFVNGKLEASSTLLSAPGTPASPRVNIGTAKADNGQYTGMIDEVALWSRAVTDAEVLELYRRGANRVKYQARSCVDAACNCKAFSGTSPSTTDCDGDAIINDVDSSDASKSGWLGPDGTSGTYFSELHNNSVINATTGEPEGAARATALTLTFSSFPAAARPANNKYFQYRTMLESDDENNLCAGAAPCLPELTSLTVGPAGRYYGGKPSIQNKTGVSYATLESMTRVDTGSCTTYQISKDGTNWKYWTGSAWAAAASSSNANYLSSYDATNLHAFGAGTFFFKAFFESTGLTSACDLSSVELGTTP